MAQITVSLRTEFPWWWHRWIVILAVLLWLGLPYKSLLRWSVKHCVKARVIP